VSNIAGKAYAMNVITPLRWYTTWLNKLIFLAALKIPSTLSGLITLSLIHYARWTIIGRRQFPHLHPSQPKESLKYSYMLFFSNFNGSWVQYVDSFHMSIPSGLDLLWFKNVKYPNSVPLQPFHNYITFNQIWTNHYYNAYPMAASNDIKGAQELNDALAVFISASGQDDPKAFQKRYEKLLLDQQRNLGLLEPTPIVSLSADAVMQRGHSHGK
jgi:hypothetical protein